MLVISRVSRLLQPLRPSLTCIFTAKRPHLNLQRSFSQTVAAMSKDAKKSKSGKLGAHGIQGASTVPDGPEGFNKERARCVTSSAELKDGECVVYWMSRDQRAEDNWAMIYARHLAETKQVPLRVVFCLVPKFLEATIRHYTFMIEGLKNVEKHLRDKNIPFHLELGYAKDKLPEFVDNHSACAVVADMSPLRVPMEWVQNVAEAMEDKSIPVFQVDAHNVVPVWHTSNKQEYAARTIRRKIHDNMDEFWTDFPELQEQESGVKLPDKIDWEGVYSSLEVDQDVAPIDWTEPGYDAGMEAAEDFAKNRLKDYDRLRNNPNEDSLSRLSPYYHFGQISVQRVTRDLHANYARKHSKAVQSYIEEAIVRRELSDNFCFYNKRYDSIEGAAGWAQETLDTHRNDEREYVYTQAQLERAETHDDLWNASQLQMVEEGKMHGFLRMYWAKKILEWTKSPEKALEIAIYLNNRYEIDGRDPNGYVGCMWSIAGIHDQGWKERPVYGKVRCMVYSGCKKKFDVPKFVRQYKKAGSNAAKAKKQKTLDD
eukprot:TRINITY_DN5998_c0_g1_i2.p1 TRINITY_DN5998_c0_g1~~TRINITY_DN5998_c0_g1_i2.p1  ORF type:complete len:541 (+),score=121.80 TRINITY_DN5998_c0_g1_i2:16-1638(+)